MWDFIGKLKEKITGEPVRDKTENSNETLVKDTDDGKLWTHMIEKGCPDCKTDPMVMLEGPSGGMSTNIMCEECGSKFNVTPMIGIAQRI